MSTMTTQLRLRKSTARGYPAGESHYRARHLDKTVQTAREMHERGVALRAIGAALGVPWSTVAGWVAGRRRVAQVVRVIATTRPLGSLKKRSADSQSPED